MLRRFTRALLLAATLSLLTPTLSACGPSSVEERLADAKSKIDKTAYESALKILTDILKEDPANSIAQKMTIEALVLRSEPKDIEEALKKIEEFSAKAGPDNQDFFTNKRGKVLLAKAKEMRRDRTYTNDEQGFEDLLISILPITQGSDREETIRYLGYLYDEQFERLAEMEAGDAVTVEKVQKVNEFINKLNAKLALDKDKGGKIKPYLTVPIMDDEFRKRMTKTSKRFARKYKEAEMARLEEAKRKAREEKLKLFTDALDATLKSEAITTNPLLVIGKDRITAYVPIALPQGMTAEQVTQVMGLIKDIPSAEAQLSTINPELVVAVRDLAAAELFKVITASIQTMIPGFQPPPDKVLRGSALETLVFDKFEFVDMPPVEGQPPGLKQPRITTSLSTEELLNLTIEYEIAVTQNIDRDNKVDSVEAQGGDATAPKDPPKDAPKDAPAPQPPSP